MVDLFRRLAYAGIILGLCACEPSTALYKYTNEPMLTLILSAPDSLPPVLFQDPRVKAVFAITGVPTHVDFVNANVFETYRVSDNARFEWSATQSSAIPGNARPFGIVSGNYLLADSATSRGLGRRDLKPGEKYRLHVDYAGETIDGITRIPDVPQLRVIAASDGVRVVWSRVTGVPLYLVLGASVTPVYSSRGLPGLTSDTSAVPIVIDGLPSLVRVIALDSNYARYLADTTVTQSGLRGAYGVFGAMSVSEIVVR